MSNPSTQTDLKQLSQKRFDFSDKAPILTKAEIDFVDGEENLFATIISITQNKQI